MTRPLAKPAIPPDSRVRELEAENSRLQAEIRTLKDQMKAQAMRREFRGTGFGQD